MVNVNTDNLAAVADYNNSCIKFLDQKYFLIEMDVDYRRKLWALNVPEEVFSDHQSSLRDEFEGLFRSFSDYHIDSVQFQYFKSFGRALVIYDNEELSCLALTHLQGVTLHGTVLVLQQVQPFSIGSSTLGIPDKTNNFLISPPPSPPMGWESTEESAPSLIDYNLIAAMARLRMPGEAQQVYNGTDSLPSIVVSCVDNADSSPKEHPNLSSACRTAYPFSLN